MQSKPIESDSCAIEEYQPSGLTLSSKELISSRPRWNPHPYQERAIRLMLSQAAVGLFLDPGLGKTSIVLAALTILLKKNLISRVLIVAPLRVAVHTWPSEISKWEEFHELTWNVLHGPKKEPRSKGEEQIHLINPEGLEWLIKTGRVSQYDALVIDESSKFKDSQTKRFKSLKPWIPQFKRRWILTGTPVPNGMMDLFGQIYILDLGRSLGRFITHYRRQFFVQSGFGGYTWSPQPDAFPRIVQTIAPLILQLSSEEYLQMPELVYMNRPVTLPPEALKIYKDLENEFISDLDSGAIVAANAAVAGVKCRQVANGAVYRDGDDARGFLSIHAAKLEALGELLEELGGAPVIVLYEFDHDRERIQSFLGQPVPVLGSGLSEARLRTLIEGFNAGVVPVLLGHPASMGHGLNLQGSCHHIIWFGIPWNLEHYVQAIARVYRQGQKSGAVFVYHIVASGTLDEKVLRVLTQKDREEKMLLEALSSYRQEQLEGA